jgi:hypothetical protein
MRENGNKEYTKSEVALHEELVKECFPSEMSIYDIATILKTQFLVRNLKPVEDIKPTNPPPKLDIAIPQMKIAIRVNGLIHRGAKQQLKDEDQKIVLEGNGWTVIDVNYDDREDLWE